MNPQSSKNIKKKVRKENDRKSFLRRHIFPRFLSRHIFVRSATQKRSANNLLGSRITLEKNSVIFVHRISAPRGDNPSQYSRKRKRNIKTTTTGKQSKVYFLTKYNITSSKNCKKKVTKENDQKSFLRRHIFSAISQSPYFAVLLLTIF